MPPPTGPSLSAASTATEQQIADGRALRGERTRRALAEAMIALLEEGDESPTARRIAERAGVSLRLVFHHFEDVEALLKEAVAVQAERHWRSIRPVRTSTKLQSRVRLVVGQRCELYDAIAPVRRAAASIERTSPTISAELGRARELLRRQLEHTFRPELSLPDASFSRRLLDALETASSFEAWDALRRTGRTNDEARRVIELLVGSALGGGPR